MLEDVVICEPVRTPVGRFGGQFRDLHAHELGRMVIEGLLARTNLPGDRVDEVIFAQCYPSMDAPALGRVVGLDAGLPISIGGYQIDRRCGSGLQAVINAVMQVATGGSSLVIAGGAESMSNAPFYSTKGRWGIKGTAMVFDDALAKGRVTAGGTFKTGILIASALTVAAFAHSLSTENDDFLLTASNCQCNTTGLSSTANQCMQAEQETGWFSWLTAPPIIARGIRTPSTKTST